MDSTAACLEAWMPQQRWYSAKATVPRLRTLAVHELASPDPHARVRVHVVVDDAVDPAVTYQVPVVARPTAVTAEPEHIVGTLPDGTVLIDGPHDPAYAAALLDAIAPGTAAPGTAAPATVLAGEQSNTSVIYAPAAGTPVIVKVFRRLQPGPNPEVELQSALAEAGSPHVPRAVGHLETTWTDPGDAHRTATGVAAFAQEFFPDVEDAWRVALVAAAAGESFSAPAHALGAATAEVHLDLARLLPVVPAGEQERGGVRAAWARRLGIAIAEVPALAAHREAIAAVYARADGIRWPALQRIHGDYHLGQVLQVPGRGWVVLDFEGEPMRPIDERRAPDAVARDVAGMLRSFDYIAGALPEIPHVAEWAATARRAFLGGYEDRTGMPATGPLLDAFELDKAVYEAIYEARNRPDWLGIPLAAVERIIARD
ncbi:aminoglycoside phosphotransferase [Microbacterium sp. W1N]|uniref:maltokinase N-terminal cap-like domain-containing protein n=1 Tax=Microbacterium festucae TaxID=2977531 RepID=UPI0021C1492D|nr:aminoglycoside phosphotransferase [Microbacterium festucae]MCT9820417.1 aminoglycoside phosphotransferase [Microbacterium festucae]